MTMRWLPVAAIAMVLASCRGCTADPDQPAPAAAAPNPEVRRPSPVASSEDAVNLPGLEFVHIPATNVHFGCEPQDTMCRDNEKPAKDIAVPAFELSRTETTVAQYGECVSAGKCTAPGAGAGGRCNWGAEGRENHPINCVNLDQAEAFCAWIGGRVPSAQEWEAAAKGGESRVFPWGDDIPDPRLAEYESQDGTAPVGTHPAGATKQGVQDMAGNVWEWTSSMYDPTWSEVRGGSWRNPQTQPYLMRCSHRGRRPADDQADFLGFRCAR